MISYTYVTAMTGNAISFVTGTALTWSSPTLPKLNVTDSSNPLGHAISDDENSWIGSLLALGAVFGPFLFGHLADRFGRKPVLISVAVPFIASFLTLAFAETVALYYASRLLIGLGVGGMFTVLPMYLGEVAEDTNRGTLGSAMNCFITFGLLFSYAVGPYLSIAAFNGLLAAVPAVYMVAFFFVAPESPHFYVRKGDKEAATRSLERLRGGTEKKYGDNVKSELEEITTSIEKQGEATIGDLFKTRATVKALVTSVALMAFQQMSGINVVLFYAQTVFDASGSGMDPAQATIIVGVVQFTASFVTPLLVERAGRKILLCFSAVGMLLAQVLLGAFFYMKNDGQDVDGISWLPVVSLVVYIITYNCGFGPLPWALMGELFPANVKSVASSVTASVCWIFGFVITRFFSNVSHAMGMGPSFWLFAGFCGLAFFFVLFYVMETKGKSLQEIQDMLES